MRIVGRPRYWERSGLDSGNLSRKVPEVLELTGLKGIKKRVGDYSKGMVQRLALAQAILNEPEFLFFDEPTDGLDPLGRKQVRDLLLQWKQRGKTIFLNSHLLSEIELVCDKVLIMDKGQIVREGSPREFMAATGEVKISLAEMNGAVRAAISSVTEPIRSSGNTFWIRPADRAQLNAVIDRLRAAQVEIESIEPVRSTLEESFLQIVSSGGESQ